MLTTPSLTTPNGPYPFLAPPLYDARFARERLLEMPARCQSPPQYAPASAAAAAEPSYVETRRPCNVATPRPTFMIDDILNRRTPSPPPPAPLPRPTAVRPVHTAALTSPTRLPAPMYEHKLAMPYLPVGLPLYPQYSRQADIVINPREGFFSRCKLRRAVTCILTESL